MVWGGIFTLQIVSHVPLFSIDFPLNEIKFLSFLNRIVSFDLFQTKPLLNNGFSESEPFNQNFARLGYTSSNFFENLGVLPLFATAVPLILCVLKLCLRAENLCKNGAMKKVNEALSWALILNVCSQLFMLSFIELLIATFIGLNLPSDLQGDIKSADVIAMIAPYLCLLELGLFMLYVFYYAGLKNSDMIHLE